MQREEVVHELDVALAQLHRDTHVGALNDLFQIGQRGLLVVGDLDPFLFAEEDRRPGVGKVEQPAEETEDRGPVGRHRRVVGAALVAPVMMEAADQRIDELRPRAQDLVVDRRTAHQHAAAAFRRGLQAQQRHRVGAVRVVAEMRV